MGKMTIQRALSEIKLLDSRIQKEVGVIIPVTSITGKKNLTNANTTKEEYEKHVKSYKQSIEDLIARRKRIKQSIVLANATNKVTIGGIEYFIAEAIEKKSSIGLEEAFLDRLKKSLYATEMDIDKRNNTMEQKLDGLLSDKASSDKSKLDEVLDFQKSYRELNETKLYDVIGIKDVIKKLEEEIENFKHEVDFSLSEINNTITIEV